MRTDMAITEDETPEAAVAKEIDFALFLLGHGDEEGVGVMASDFLQAAKFDGGDMRLMAVRVTVADKDRDRALARAREMKDGLDELRESNCILRGGIVIVTVEPDGPEVLGAGVDGRFAFAVKLVCTALVLHGDAE